MGQRCDELKKLGKDFNQRVDRLLIIAHNLKANNVFTHVCLMCLDECGFVSLSALDVLLKRFEQTFTNFHTFSNNWNQHEDRFIFY